MTIPFGGKALERCYTIDSDIKITIMEIKEELRRSIYDNAKQHFLGNFPESLPIEQAYVHIGIYLGWIIETTLYSDYFEEEASNQIFRFKRREISCTILSEIWDGNLSHEFFNKHGNMFTYYYYAGGLYQLDYNELLVKTLPSIYHVDDSWENYEKIKSRIDSRLQDWKKLVNAS